MPWGLLLSCSVVVFPTATLRYAPDDPGNPVIARDCIKPSRSYQVCQACRVKDDVTLGMPGIQSRGCQLAIRNLAIRNGLKRIQLPELRQAPSEEPDIICEALSSRLVRMDCN